MGFWANVEAELNYQGISRKELAHRAEISYAGIGLGLERNSMPGADTALRISKALNVSIEYLLSGTDNECKTLNLSEFDTFKKYRSLLHDIDNLPSHIREPLCDMIHRISVK